MPISHKLRPFRDTYSGEGHINIFGFMYDSVVAGTWTFRDCDAFSTAFGRYLVWNQTGAQNDEVIYKIYLAAGTYTLKLFCLKASDCAIATFKLGTTTIATLDMYDAGVVSNAVLTQTNISVATSGCYDLHLSMATKNAASSAYNIVFSHICMYRTA